MLNPHHSAGRDLDVSQERLFTVQLSMKGQSRRGTYKPDTSYWHG